MATEDETNGLEAITPSCILEVGLVDVSGPEMVVVLSDNTTPKLVDGFEDGVAEEIAIDCPVAFATEADVEEGAALAGRSSALIMSAAFKG